MTIQIYLKNKKPLLIVITVVNIFSLLKILKMN
jgi:hypothetical protein